MYRIGNKILKRGNDLYFAENPTVLEFTVRGTSFPDRQAGGVAVRFDSDTGNVINFDFNDGTGTHRFLPNLSGKNFFWQSPNIIHYFQDLVDPLKIGTVDNTYPQERKIRIWFDFPSKVKSVNIGGTTLRGDFPKNIGNYNLDEMRFSAVRMFDSFPIRFRGGKFKTVTLSNISTVLPKLFSPWIGGSEITNLTLNRTYDLSDGSIATGVDSISNCKGLVNLYLSDLNMNTNLCFPSTLKDIPTLRDLRIGSNKYTTFPKRVGECSQVTKLIISAVDGNGSAPEFNSWGDGLGLMTSLEILHSINAPAMPTTMPIGLANCVNLKEIKFHRSFITEIRIDDFVLNFYNFITAEASLVSGNTKFRNMNLDIGSSIGAFNSIRPTGGATPTSVTSPPTTAIQRVYNLCKLYGHTFTVRNLANTGTETITPTS